MTYIIPVAIMAILFGGFFIYMKFYYPKFKEKYTAINEDFDAKWQQDKDQILGEYFSNPNKFGLVSDVIEGGSVIGMLSARLPDSFKSKTKEALIGAITLTSKVDMSHYYLVATDKGLHYTAFDGEKCILNEVFSYDHISEQKINEKTFSFVYKDEKFAFGRDLFVDGYPRFNIHERTRTATSNDRSKNYFVREYLAYEMSENVEFNTSNSVLPKFNMDMLKVSPEKIQDTKVREYLGNEFATKLGV